MGAIQKKRQNTEKFREKGSELAAVQLQELSSQLGNFQQNLESFAREHKQEIKRDPEFRRHFQVYRGSRAIFEQNIIGVEFLNGFVNFYLNRYRVF